MGGIASCVAKSGSKPRTRSMQSSIDSDAECLATSEADTNESQHKRAISSTCDDRTNKTRRLDADAEYTPTCNILRRLTKGRNKSRTPGRADFNELTNDGSVKSVDAISCGSACSSSKDERSHTASGGSQSDVSQLHINELPWSVLIHVFKRLALYDLLRRANLTCKLWHCLACNADLWRAIDLHGYMKVDDDVLARLTSYSDNVTTLDVTDSRLITSAGMTSALQGCPHLRVLRLIRCYELNKLASFPAIGLHCHSLRILHLDFCFNLTDQHLIQIGDGCRKLTQLFVNQCIALTDKSIVSVLENCPLLQVLSMEQCTKITDTSIERLAECCPGMQKLILTRCNITRHGIEALTECKKLITIELTSIPGVTCDSVKLLAKNCPHVETLNLSLCKVIDDTCIDYVARYAHNLTVANLVSCALTDKALISLGMYCKKLNTVDVGWCKDITDHGVTRISQLSSSLRYLGLMRCDLVTVETTEELVARYPAVTYSTMWLDCKRLMERAREIGFCSGDVMGPPNVNPLGLP